MSIDILKSGGIGKIHFVADNVQSRVRVFATRERIDSHGHRKPCTHIVTSQSMSQWSGKLVPGDSLKSDWQGTTRVFAYRRDYGITFPRLAYRSPIHHGCIVRRCHRRFRSRQNASRPRALLPFHCRFDAWCFTASFSVLPPMHSVLYILLSFTFGRSYSLSGCSLLCPLVL